MNISSKRIIAFLLGLLLVGGVFLALRSGSPVAHVKAHTAPVRSVSPENDRNADAIEGELTSPPAAEPIPYGGEVVHTSHAADNAMTPGERVRVLRTALKYPLVRVVDQVADNAAGRQEATSMVADHILVKLHPGKTEADLAAFSTSCRTTIRKQMLAPQTYVIQLPDHGLNAVPQAVEVFRRQSDLIEYAEPDYMVTAASITPNDTNFSALWGMHNTGQTGGLADADIDAPEAWSIGTGSRTIKVGVIDSGIDYNHPDLAANIWANPGESGGSKPTNGIDDDGNGFIDDVRGWDFMSDDKDPKDYWAHGTHVAGTIGAVGNNSSYVAGVCWQVTLVPIKAVDFAANGGAGYISDTADATYYATKVGCHLTCNSYGGAAYSKVMEDAIRDANDHGVLFVASAGNETRNTDLKWRYPSCYDLPNIICVGASDHNDQPAAFDYPWTSAGTDAETNYGFETVDIFAPGSFIYSTYPTAKTPLMTSQNLPINYGQLSGTSMSAPHVAGACALLMSQAPTLSHLAVKNAILGTADPKAALTGKCVTGARLNLHSALLASQQAAVSIGSQVIDDDGTGSSIGNGDGLVNPGETIELRISLRNVGAVAANAVSASLALMSPNPHVAVQAGGVGFGNLAPGQASAQAGTYVIQVAGNAPVPLLTQMLLTITDSGGHTWTQAVAFTVYNSSSVSGTVRRNDGEPMEGVEIVVTGLGRRTALTDSLGMYSITLPAGFSYQVAAQKTPFITVSKNFTLPPAAANVDFTMHRFRSVNLGTLGGSWAYAYAINDAGQIVGVSTDSAGVWRGFLWQNNSMVALNALLPGDRPFDINNKGEIIAGKYIYKAGAVTQFAALGTNDFASAINDLGTIVGRRVSSGPGFLYKDGTLSQFVIDLPPDISSRGQAAGQITGTGAAIVQNGQTTVLPSPVGFNALSSIARAISDAKVAVGHSQVQDDYISRAMRWENGGVQQLSADMPDILDSRASDINERGLICGKFWKLSYTTDTFGNYNYHACFWDAGALVDVHGLGPNLGTSWTTGLSNAGAILGNWANKGYNSALGGPGYQSLAYAIVPVITCVEKGSKWRFLASTTPPAGNWNTPAGDDSGWTEGRAILGYGESYVNTAVPFGSDPQNRHITTYFRKSFNVSSNPSRITELALSVCYDDGFIVYLNGQVVANRSISVGAAPGDLAQSHESNNPIAPNQPIYETIDLSAHTGKLVRGTNVIAVELHQASANSDDLVWDAEMTYETWRHPASAGAFVMDYDEDAMADDFEWRIINHNASDSFDTLLSVLPNGDYDGDGTTNADEYVAGTDPTTATNNPPTIITLNPADNATGVAVNSNLVATFSEAIAIGTGNITIKNLTDNSQTTIPITSGSPQITVSGATLTINPTANLMGGKSYAIQIAATAIKDLSNNLYVGISNDTTWNFATVEVTPPTIITLSPADNATGVAVNSNLVATFSQAIAIGTGNITIKNLSDNTQTTIPITSGSPQITISGSTLTINPTANLAAGKLYAIQIAATAIKDLSNNPFGGISDDTTWNFSTTNANIFGSTNDIYISNTNATSNTTHLWAGSDNTNPEYTTFAQYRSYLDFDMTGLTANGTVTNATVYLYFDPDGDCQYGTSYLRALSAAYTVNGTYAPLAGTAIADPGGEFGGGFISNGTLVNYGVPNTPGTAGWKAIDVTSVVEGWRASNLATEFGFSILGSEGAYGNALQKIRSFDYADSSFRPYLVVTQNPAPDISNPTIATLNPADNATGVAVSSNLVATFSEAIAIGTGNITIRNLTDNTETTIPITSGSPQVTVSGSTLTINPTANLLGGKLYAIQIATTAIKDLSNNPFVGISDDTTWNFTTANQNIFYVSETPKGTSSDSDFHITETAKNTLVDGATFTVGSMSNTNNDLRAYLGFDLTGLTANGTVTNATLRLFRDVVPGSGAANTDAYGNADVYARTAAFVAGAGGGATDYDELTGTLLGTISTGDLATAQYFELDVTAIVESWRTNNLTNHFGFAMQGLEGYTETGKQFQSRTGSNVPQLVVTQDPAPSNNFANWIDDPAFGLAPADQDLNDDPDGDGQKNGIENYFGTHPGVFSQGLISGAVDTGANTFTFTHPINATPASDLTAAYRWSTDLQTFHDDGDSNGAATTTVTFAQGTPSAGMVTVTATITGTVIPTKLFVVVKVTQP